ncbi:MAG: triphosphoribosyl-dephospho-CoA synthase [Gammaproteobacteria bacterium]
MIAPGEVAAAVLAACRADVEALKPGNVGLHGDGHGMRAVDFSASAEAVAPAIAAPGLALGTRVLASIRATTAVVDCNTNLGIVLLAAPLVHAAYLPSGSLRERVRCVLGATTREDARAVYAAIRLARPGGLGAAPEHDVAGVPSVTLAEAMAAASGRDRIALQYATGFDDLFDVCLPRLAQAWARGRDRLWSVTGCFLGIAARWPDTLIARKFGAQAAEEVRQRFVAMEKQFEACENPERCRDQLQHLDIELKRAGFNPGTSADFTVATLLAQQLGSLLQLG